ncbi:single-stranded DNA-binding protein [Woeseia oceani]|uniref:Single-stranded DNA-binding protein n=1 Tax=Woeseia oceani TaxID=1548547 RepID=A0A193LCE6_9GAMM|nr:single-stranded DNA-binding protein [Woeseia oceani]ANO50069.1 hypothetical protein BA177_01490 [Woeseia oceani]
MLILNVHGPVHERTAVRKDGIEFRVRFQEAEILRGERRPRLVEISVPKTNTKYGEGLYTLSGQSFRPNQYDKIELVFPTLIGIEEALKTASETKGAIAGEKRS